MLEMPQKIDALLSPNSERGISYIFCESRSNSIRDRFFLMRACESELLRFFMIITFVTSEKERRAIIFNKIFKEFGIIHEKVTPFGNQYFQFIYSMMILYVFVTRKLSTDSELNSIYPLIENRSQFLHVFKLCQDGAFLANQLKNNYGFLLATFGQAERMLRATAFSRLADRLKRNILYGLKESKYFDSHRKIFIGQDWQGNIGHLNVLPYFARANQRSGKKIILQRLPKDNVSNFFYLSLIQKFFGFEFSDRAPNDSLAPRNTGSTFFEGEYGAFKNFDFERKLDMEEAILPPPPDAYKFRIHFLKKLGWSPDSKIVTLNVRDWRVSNSLTNRARSASVSTYIAGINALVRLGYRVVRVGGPNQEELPRIDGFFDYARSNFKSDRNDIFLLATAAFHIGSSSGISLVPLTFGRPCLMLNWFPRRDRPWGRKTVTVFKHLVWRDTNQVMRDEDLLARFGGVVSPLVLDAFGLKLVDNSPDEIERAILNFASKLPKDTADLSPD